MIPVVVSSACSVTTPTGKQVPVHFRRTDDWYTLKQRLRQAQAAADGFALDDFELVESLTGEVIGLRYVHMQHFFACM